MAALVSLESSEGTVLFEGDFTEAALQEIAISDRAEDVVKATSTTVKSVASTVRRCANDLLVAFDDLATEKRAGGSLSKAVIEMGITLSGEGNVIVAKGTAEANLKVTLTWDFG